MPGALQVNDRPFARSFAGSESPCKGCRPIRTANCLANCPKVRMTLRLTMRLTLQVIYANDLAIELRICLANGHANGHAMVTGQFAPPIPANRPVKRPATSLANVARSFARPDAPRNTSDGYILDFLATGKSSIRCAPLRALLFTFSQNAQS